MQTERDPSLLEEFDPGKKPRRGRVYFYVGLVLVFLQLASYLGSAGKTVDVEMESSIWYHLGYNFFILAGILLVIIGFRKGI